MSFTGYGGQQRLTTSGPKMAPQSMPSMPSMPPQIGMAAPTRIQSQPMPPPQATTMQANPVQQNPVHAQIAQALGSGANVQGPRRQIGMFRGPRGYAV